MMGWAVGTLDGRHIGYGVPANCDHPECDEQIDRGLGYRCGDLSDAGCDLFFCTSHLQDVAAVGPRDHVNVCERCAAGEPAFDPSPDTVEWAQHVLTDESWAQWRKEQPEWAERMRRIVNPSEGTT